jgi:hypothetical protein
LPTPFSRCAEDRLLLAAAGASRLKVLNRNAAAAIDPLPKESYGAFHRETGAEASLSGRFFLEGDKVRVALLLIELSSGTLIGAADWNLPASSVPGYASVKPASTAVDRARELAKLSSTAPGGLTVSVSTDRGAGAAYRSGENLTVIVGVNKDAWVRVFHVEEQDFSDLGTSASRVMTRGLSVLGPGSASGKLEVAESLASYCIGP